MLHPVAARRDTSSITFFCSSPSWAFQLPWLKRVYSFPTKQLNLFVSAEESFFCSLVRNFLGGIMKGIDVLKFSSRALWIFLFVAILLVASVPVLPQHDMSNMPGMSKPKPKSKSQVTSRKKRKPTLKKQTAKKHDMSNMPAMNMPGMKMSGTHRRRGASRRKRTPGRKNSANQQPMSNMPGTNMP